MGTGFRNVKACGLTVWFEMMDEECWCADERVIEIGFSRFDDENLESRKSFSQSACNHTSGCPTYISIRIKTIKPPTIMMSTSFGTSSMSRLVLPSITYILYFTCQTPDRTFAKISLWAKRVGYPNPGTTSCNGASTGLNGTSMDFREINHE